MKSLGVVLLSISALLTLAIIAGMLHTFALAANEAQPRPNDVANMISLTLLLGIVVAAVGPLGQVLLIVG